MKYVLISLHPSSFILHPLKRGRLAYSDRASMAVEVEYVGQAVTT
jgi:hypothetical protein